MSKTTGDAEEIHSYLSGELTGENLVEFEKRLKNEKDIQNEVALTKKVIEGVQGYGFKLMLKDIHQRFAAGTDSSDELEK